MLQDSTGAEDALRAVGEILKAEGQSAAVVIVGGTALNLLGLVDRATRDVDVIALGEPPTADRPTPTEPKEGLPSPLARAARLVGTSLGLDGDWLNLGPSLQWHQGFPPDFENRIQWRRYAGLSVGLAARRDLIFLKLYAAADSIGTNNVHYQDLVALRPSPDELASAGDWVSGMDASPEFPELLKMVMDNVRRDAQ